MSFPELFRAMILFILIVLILSATYYYRTDYFANGLTVLAFSLCLSFTGFFTLGTFYIYFERTIREFPKRAKTINRSLIATYVLLFTVSSAFAKLLTWFPTIVCLAFGFILASDITFTSLLTYGFLVTRRPGKNVQRGIVALGDRWLLFSIAIVMAAAAFSFIFYLEDLPWALVIVWQTVLFLGTRKTAPWAGLEPATYWLTASCSTS